MDSDLLDSTLLNAIDEIRRCKASGSAHVERTPTDAACPDVPIALSTLVLAVRDASIRDADFTTSSYKSFFVLAQQGWSVSDVNIRKSVMYFFTRIMSLPEYDISVPESTPPHMFLEDLFQQLSEKCDSAAELSSLQQVLFWTYSRFPHLRTDLRTRIGKCLRSFQLLDAHPNAVDTVLGIVVVVVQGFQTPLLPTHVALLKDLVLPLHKSNALVGAVKPTRGGGGGAGGVASSVSWAAVPSGLLHNDIPPSVVLPSATRYHNVCV
eukprot:m.282751 g.282751  ORF g.282751 m.282751 type:complete len:266 (+) comp19865_c0_seq2:370-1167(+)